MFLFHQSKIKYDATHYDMCAKNANKKNRKFAFITGSAILLATTVAISFMLTEDAFARNGRYGAGDTTSQAAAGSNDCLNPIFDSNTIDNVIGAANCGGTVSQQGESGQASSPITLQIASPRIEQSAQPPTPPTPPTGPCEECFAVLTPDQIAAFEEEIGMTIPEACVALQDGTLSVVLVGVALNDAGVPNPIELDIVGCLLDLLGMNGSP
jgi:hypothetical protein